MGARQDLTIQAIRFAKRGDRHHRGLGRDGNIAATTRIAVKVQAERLRKFAHFRKDVLTRIALHKLGRALLVNHHRHEMKGRRTTDGKLKLKDSGSPRGQTHGGKNKIPSGIDNGYAAEATHSLQDMGMSA